MSFRILIIALFVFQNCSNAQWSLEAYTGGWAGTFETNSLFVFDVLLHLDKNASPILTLKGEHSTTTLTLEQEDHLWTIPLNEMASARLKISDNVPILFMQIGHHLCHIALENQDDTWVGTWELLINSIIAPTLYLSLENEQGLYASTFFKEPTFHYMMGVNFQDFGTYFQFRDLRSSLRFTGKPKNNSIELNLEFLNERVTLDMQRLAYDDWAIGSFDGAQNINLDQIDPQFHSLINDVLSDTLEQTHSILLAQEGEILLEEYFDGFTSNTVHDTRSAAKTIGGAMMGIAIDEGLIHNDQEKIKKFFTSEYPETNWSGGKDKIEIRHLLTMSSGLDAIDFGLNRNSYASEGAYQNTDDWTRRIIEAPMVNPVGQNANYGSGNPHLLGPIIQQQISEPLEFFIHETLMKPLGRKNYRIQTTNEVKPYFGGGWYLSPRDQLAFAQLLLDNGFRNGQQIISEGWVNKTLMKHARLENAFDKNEYGYLMWHKSYDISGQNVDSIEGRGSGGQYFFVVPQLKVACVITSGNYRNGKGFQPERIFRDYILPVLLDK